MAPARLTKSIQPKVALKVFMRDHFTDRYTGEKLLFRGILRIYTLLDPDGYPYHPNGKFGQCHPDYWDRQPSVDHIIPRNRGGSDDLENLLTTSSRNNCLVKKARPVAELGWSILPIPDDDWDGELGLFLKEVENDPSWLRDDYIRNCYSVAKPLCSLL